MTALFRALAVLLLLAAPAAAVQPDEMLADPVLEQRARDIGKVLRCPVCQGETIDESNAAISRDLRLFVRERLAAGDSDAQTIAAVTRRFGEYVLFEPPKSGGNLLLWLAGPAMAGIGLILAARLTRRRPEPGGAPTPLTAAERARLDELTRS